MLNFKWSRTATTLGFFVLVLLACWTESKNTNSKKELRVRNKREGTWSDWSAWSPCSRSCGGGIRTQTRQCQIRRLSSKSKEVGDDPRNFKNVSSRHCEGHGSRHHLCHTHDCPKDTVDFRESQCKAFDNRAYMGKVYSWESFIDERSPCALTCRAKGFRFFATLNKSVIDGTPCDSNPFDSHVCIAGVCTPIGCDGIAGSQRRLDRCGVCGGDNSTCRVVSGIFTRPQLAVGYNLVAHIPQGACNLNITQIRKSTNRLALRKIDGSFILNGDWRLSWPGIYEGAGTKFYYTRQDTKSLESIASSGPLDEPVDLMVLYQQPNPGIKYEYMLPMSDSSNLPPVPILDPLSSSAGNRQQNAATYRPTSYVNNPLIPNTNGGNGQYANAYNTIPSFPKPPISSVSTPTGPVAFPGDSASAYSKPETQQQSHPHVHGHQSRRRGHSINKLGGGSEKKFYWKVVGYTNCTEICGGGTQKSLVKCVKSPAGNTVSDRRCAGEEKPAQQTIRCNIKPCPAEWDVGSWSTCSELCGEGLKTRTVHCQQRISPALTMRVVEGACLKPKPESQTKCFIRPCHRWEASEWSQCSAPCGNGIRRRTVVCLDGRGQKIDKQDCDDADRPLEISPCNMGPCEGVDWFMSDWSTECSQRCGSGVQTRHVVCSGSHQNFTGRRRSLSSETETNSIEDEDPSGEEDGFGTAQTFFCDDSKKPKDERECFSDRSCGDPSWFTGEWSECSTVCGNGLKTRQVLCVLFSRGKFKVVEEPLCSLASRPEEKVQCESDKGCPPRWFISEWSECSTTCGGGTQRRSVSCRAGNWTRPSSYCADVDRPLDKRSCNEQKCSLGPSRSTDSSGMLKDTAPGALLVASTGRNVSVTGVVKPSIQVTTTAPSRIQVKEPSEDPEDPDCTDQYRNCPLVVQARLCRYKYYRSVCCRACSEAQDFRS